MKNKEVIDRLVEYFLTQDPATVARLCAANMIDLHRVVVAHLLDLPESMCLKERMRANSKELVRFAKHGPRGPLKHSVLNSDQEDWKAKMDDAIKKYEEENGKA